MKNNLKSWRHVVTMAGLTLGLIIPPISANSSGPSTIEGTTYGEWSARWWKWVRSIPSATNPLTASGEVDCLQGQDDRVLFLAGTVVGPVDRTCKNPIPQGRTLFLSPLNFLWNNDPADVHPKDLTEAQKRALLHGLLSDILPEDPTVAGILGVESHACNLDITVNGQSIVFDAVPIVRTQSPAFRIKIRKNDVFGGTKGAVDPQAVADGFWVAQRLSKGTHTLHLQGALCGPNNEVIGFQQDYTYHLRIE